MLFFGKAIPLLFAAPSALRIITTPQNAGITVTASLRSTVEKAEIADDLFTPRNMVDLSNDSYRDLAKGCAIVKGSPTVSFHYTRPVAERTTDKIMESSAGSNTDESQLYETIKASHDNSKPLLLYLPGLDGVGISATLQFDDLSNTFEFWRMRVNPKNDRSSFTDLTTAVSNFIRDVAVKQDRKIILVGESFGGLLAPSVAMRMERIAGGKENTPIMGMVLVNPATSFEKTNWSSLATILASLRHIEREEQEGTSLSLPTLYSVIGGITLSATIPDSAQYQKILNNFANTRVTTAEELQEVVETMRDGFGILAENLPAEVIEHRVGQWCNVGSQVVSPRLHKLHTPTLFIGGDEDNMLPTKEEGDRLVKVMPDCTSMAVRDAGHFVLDDRFNLTSAIIDAPFDPFGKRKNEKNYDPITDWKLPSDDDVREAVENRVKPLRTLTSPKFFSTTPEGKRKLGLGQVPTPDGPLLFVANHQLIGLDLGMIIAELIEERGITARGLAHPIVFQGANGQSNTNGFGGPGRPRRITKRNKEGMVDAPPGDFQNFGAVMVTPKNFYRLMATGQTGLLFPGGVREVFHGKGEDYELFWPEKVDFVRVASRFNATIVPISAVGSADSANILLDPEEILNLPFGLGERVKNSTENTIAARFDQSNSDERFVPPVR